MSRLALYLLGPPRIERVHRSAHDGEAVPIGRRKALALLAYLAVTGRRHSRDTLATLFWPDYDQRAARGRLRRTLSTLSRTLGDGCLTADRDTVCLNPDSEWWLDVDQFRQGLASCEEHGHPASEACPECLAYLSAAAELYRDDFMAGFTLSDSQAFDDWQRYQTDVLRDELASVLGRLAGFRDAQGEVEAAIGYARRWLELDHLHEPAHRRLMELFARADRRGAALRQYRHCVRLLEEELGVPPSAETTALYESLRAEQEVTPPIATPSRPQLHAPAFLRDQEASAQIERPVFVARERELAQLDCHLEEAFAGQGKVVFVTGGPGRGKTALIGEFARRALDAHPDLLVASGTCNAYSGAGDPYLPFRDALAALTGDVEGRWAAGALSRDHARRLWDVLPLTVQTLMDCDPHLIDVFLPGAGLMSRAAAFAASHTADDGGWLEQLREWTGRTRAERVDLEQRYLFEQYTGALRALAVQHPLLLTLDDLQWADGPSIQLLFHLGRRLAEEGGRVLVVGAYRGEEVALGRPSTSSGQMERHPLEPVLAEFKRRYGDVWLDLGRMDELEAREFVDAYLDSEPNRLGDAFRESLCQRTGGHALFTVELVRALQARGDVAQDPDAEGAWADVSGLDWERLPARVEAVIETRLGRLDDELCEILRVASVEGERFTAQVVAQAAGIPEREVLRDLSHALGPGGHRLVREAGETRVEAGGLYLSRYQFVHALYQAYVYERLSPGERRFLHGDVGMALETVYGAQSGEIAVGLAHHFAEAGNADKAVEYALLAGEQARRAYANNEAIAYFQRALDSLPPASSPPAGARPVGRGRDALRLAALRGLGQVHVGSGDVAAAEGYFRQAIEIGKTIELPPKELVRLYWWLGDVLYWLNRLDEQVRVGEEGLELLGDDLASAEAALMYQTTIVGLYSVGDVEIARERIRHTAQIVQRLTYTEEFRSAYVTIAFQGYIRGEYDFAQAMAWLRTLEEKAGARRDLRALGDANNIAADILEYRGDFHGAVRRYQKAVEYFDRIGDAKHVARNLSMLAFATLCIGQPHESEAYALRCLETVGSTVFPASYWALWCLGVVYAGRGAWAQAASALGEAVDLSRRAGVQWAQAVGLADLAHVTLVQGAREKAIALYHEAAPSATPAVGFEISFPALVLSGLERAYADPEEFRAFCLRFRHEHPQVGDLSLANWYLERADVAGIRGLSAVHDTFAHAPSSEWEWQDPLGRCSYVVGDGLVIRATNGRDLWRPNMSAPRLVRPLPEGVDFAVQTVCGPGSDCLPAICGLSLWGHEGGWLRFDVGAYGAEDVIFLGRLDDQDVFVGRGSLHYAPHPVQTQALDARGKSADSAPALGPRRVVLRLERVGERVRAMCSADGETWFTAGQVEFPFDDGPVHVGLHAIGWINRGIYYGAFPEGTAVRFESFTLWEL